MEIPHFRENKEKTTPKQTNNNFQSVVFACFKRNKTFLHFLAIKKAPKPQEDVASNKQCEKPH